MFSFFRRKPINAKPTEAIEGNQRGVRQYEAYSWYKRDLEIEEKPIRNPALAIQLLEMQEYCWEVFHTLETIGQDTFLSTDGDDQGFTIADTQNDGVTPVNADLKVIGLDLLQRTFDDDEYVIGGDRLVLALEESLGNGDSFLELGFDTDGLSRYPYISRSLYLPTWSMFRVETDKGELLQFEQRQYLSDEEAIVFDPTKIIHFRHRRKRLYGRSIFLPSRYEWDNLKNAVDNAARVLKEGNPTLHRVMSGADSLIMERYKNDYEASKSDRGIITDLFLSSNVEVAKLCDDYPDLRSYFEAILYHRKKMIPAGMPEYYYGIDMKGGSKELAREPARRYARARNSFCALLTKGIKRAINIELINIKGREWFEKEAKNKYRIVWPKWIIDADLQDTNDESDNQGVEDLDQASSNEQKLR